jgi:putative tricarboxylic transport membrane protein
MFKLPNDLASAAIWFALGAAIAAASLRYGLGTPDSPGTGFMPFWAGVAIAFFALIGMIQGALKARGETGWRPVLQDYAWGKSLVVITALFAYALLLKPLGFFLCTALFIGFLLRVVRPQRWLVVFLGALATAGGAYAIFEVWLQAQLPKGPWGF